MSLRCACRYYCGVIMRQRPFLWKQGVLVETIAVLSDWIM
jgi:hypothetical protein